MICRTGMLLVQSNQESVGTMDAAGFLCVFAWSPFVPEYRVQYVFFSFFDKRSMWRGGVFWPV